jgi:brefeldin A-inhibited guanine nucleotide-exchange protein
MLDFTGLLFDDAIKYYLSGFRLPGEAQKVSNLAARFSRVTVVITATTDIA